MHCCHLGIYQVVVAEAILVLHELYMRQGTASSREAALEATFVAFRAWCKKNRIACSQRRWGSRAFKADLDQPAEFPELGSKAFNTRVILAWTAAELAKPDIFEALAASDDNWSKLARLTRVTTVAIAAWQNDLEAAPRYLTPARAEGLYQKGMTFLRLIRAAAVTASEAGFLHLGFGE